MKKVLTVIVLAFTVVGLSACYPVFIHGPGHHHGHHGHHHRAY